MTGMPSGRPSEPRTGPAAPAPAHGDGPTGPSTPTGRTALRERLREALIATALRQAREKGIKLSTFTTATIRANAEALANAVLPVIEAETGALRQRIEEVEEQRDQALAWQDTAERELRNAERRLAAAERIAAALEAERDKARAAVADEQRRADERRTELLEERDEALNALADAEKRAEQAERALAQARDAIADERRGRLTAEAAVRRARELADRAEMTADVIDPEGTRIQFAAVAVRDLRAALDAEQPKETP